MSYIKVNRLHHCTHHWIHTQVKFPLVAGSYLCQRHGEWWVWVGEGMERWQYVWAWSHLVTWLGWCNISWRAALLTTLAWDPWVSWGHRECRKTQWGPAYIFASMPQPSQEAAPAAMLPRLDCVAKAGPLIIQTLDMSSMAQLVWVIVYPQLFANATQNCLLVCVARTKCRNSITNPLTNEVAVTPRELSHITSDSWVFSCYWLFQLTRDWTK